MTAPDRIGEYEVLGEIGRGAMGVVYRARKASLPDREVALKEVPVAIEGDDRTKKLREAKALTRMQSLHIVGLVDVFEAPDRGSVCIVMERLKSETLRDRLTAVAGPLDVDLAMDVADGMLDAIEAAHEAVGDDGSKEPIVHRDLKPENVGYADWRGSEIVKVMDFGIAHVADSKSAHATTTAFTPAYAAPEVLLGEPATPAADLFAMGVILWEMLVGRHPLADGRGKLPPPAIVQGRIAGEPIPPIPDHLLPRIPEALVDLVRDLCGRDPLLRPTAHEARARLARARGGAPARSGTRPACAAEPAVPSERSRAPVVAGIALLGAMGVGAVLFLVWPSSDPEPLPTSLPATIGPGLTLSPETSVPILDVNLDVDTPEVSVAREALAPGSYRCRLDAGTSVSCSLALTGGSTELPSYRLLTIGGDRSLDGTLTRLGGSSYRFDGRLVGSVDPVPAEIAGSLESDARATSLSGTLTGTVPLRFELRR